MGNKPVEVVYVKKTKSRSGTEIKDWREKFIKTVETTWSSNIPFYCHLPEWESLKASVIVKVDVMGEEIPAKLEPFRAKVFRGDIPPGPCYGKGECVRKAEAILTYESVQNGGGVVAHEFGHMLGLGDEYAEQGEPKEASHSEWLKWNSDTAFPDHLVSLGCGKVLCLKEQRSCPSTGWLFCRR